MSKKLSKEAEAKLYLAIEKTAHLVNDGDAPSDAIVKAARDQGIPPGQINLMVHAYNTGRTTNTRETGDNPLEKSADFVMADAGKVLAELYPETVKTAAAVRQSTAVSTEYAIPPDGILARREKQARQARTHDWTMGTGSKPKAYEIDPKDVVKRAAGRAERLSMGVNESRRLAAQAFDKMGSTFCELSDYFRSPGCTPIPVVRENVMIFHGGKGEQIMDQLIQVSPALGKLAHHKQASIQSSRDLRAVGPAYTLVSQLVGEISTYQQKKAEFETLQAESVKQAEVLLAPFVGGPSPQRSVLDPPSTEKRAFGALSALGFTALRSARNTAGRKAFSPDDRLVDDKLAELTDPDHEAELRSLRVRAVLDRLMRGDPVISDADPDEVVAAANEVIQTMPRSADQYMTLQSMLRERLTANREGAPAAPSQLAEALGIDKGIGDAAAPHASDVTMRGQDLTEEQSRRDLGQRETEHKSREDESAREAATRGKQFKTEQKHKKKELKLKGKEFGLKKKDQKERTRSTAAQEAHATRMLAESSRASRTRENQTSDSNELSGLGHAQRGTQQGENRADSGRDHTQRAEQHKDKREDTELDRDSRDAAAEEQSRNAGLQRQMTGDVAETAHKQRELQYGDTITENRRAAELQADQADRHSKAQLGQQRDIAEGYTDPPFMGGHRQPTLERELATGDADELIKNNT